MNPDDRYLYGLAPSDFTIDQIKKIPSYILWRHSRKDSRFEDELLNRIHRIEDVRKEIELYTGFIQEDITTSPRLIELINKLVVKETNYSVIHPYFNLLTDENKRYAMNVFLNNRSSWFLYERFLTIIAERYRYIEPNNKKLINLILELLKERHRRPRILVLHLIGHLAEESFKEIYPKIKELAPPSIVGSLLYYSSYVPDKDHLIILKLMGKASGLNHTKAREFKTLIHPYLLKELALTTRLNVLKELSTLQSYPFTHRISGDFIRVLLFPLVFKRATEIDSILKNWEVLSGTAPDNLPELN